MSREFNAERVDRLMDAFQALDQTVVELAMQIYQTPAKHQSAMRLQHRCLHRAISKPLRRILANGVQMRKKQSLRAATF